MSNVDLTNLIGIRYPIAPYFFFAKLSYCSIWTVWTVDCGVLGRKDRHFFFFFFAKKR